MHLTSRQTAVPLERDEREFLYLAKSSFIVAYPVCEFTRHASAFYASAVFRRNLLAGASLPFC